MRTNKMEKISLRKIGLFMVGGVTLAAIYIAFIFATGQTFGQRCAVKFPDKGVAWEDCVQELAGGSKR